VRLQTWAFWVGLGVLMVAFVVRIGRPRKAPRAKAPEPVAPYVERPLPLEGPWGPPKVPNSDLPADVDDVLARKCRRCHGSPTRHSAPFPLYTWTDTRGQHHGRLIYERIGLVVASGFMPNLIPANPPVERLTDAEKQILVAWSAAGGPSASLLAKAPPVSSGRGRSPKPKPSR
jgi:hypothetical protein